MDNISLIKKAVENLCKNNDEEESIDLSNVHLSPSQIHHILTNDLGWEKIDLDTNGWSEVWYYYIKDSNRIGMYFCGFNFHVELFSFKEEEEEYENDFMCRN